MIKFIKTRYGQFMIFMLALMMILIVRLLVLTVVQHEYWSLRANDAAIKSINTPAPRGEIFDRYGRVLAGNTQSFCRSIFRRRTGYAGDKRGVDEIDRIARIQW